MVVNSATFAFGASDLGAIDGVAGGGEISMLANDIANRNGLFNNEPVGQHPPAADRRPSPL